MIKYTIFIIVHLCFFSPLLGQNKYCLSNYCDTIHLRELETNSVELHHQLDSVLAHPKIKNYTDDEIICIIIERQREYSVLYPFDPETDYYVRISKNNKTNNIKWANAITGYYIYSDNLFLVSIYDGIDHLFKPSGKEKEFIWPSLDKLYPKLDFLEFNDLNNVGNSYQFKVINEKWYIESISIEIDEK